MADETQDLPFVTLTSKGGVHDDVAYFAGYEMGQLDIILGIPYIMAHQITTHRSNVKQADLIAMHHGFHMEEDVEKSEFAYACLVFTRLCTCEPETVEDI